MTGDLAAFETASVEALKAIGKTLGQMSLYRVGHPAVTATLQEALRVLARALETSQSGEVAYAIDADKLIANGHVIGAAVQLPNAVLTLFNRYRLNSITFRAGISEAELVSLCELAQMRAEQAKTVDAGAYLKEHGVACIGLNEAIYAKVEKASEDSPPAQAGEPGPAAASEPAGEKPAPAQEQGAPLRETLSGKTIEQSLDVLVRTVATDPEEQKLLYQTVMQQLQADVENRVLKATESLRREKTRVENEQVRTQAVLSNMAEGVVVVDDQGKVLMMNPAAEGLYGVKLVDVAGKPLAEQVKEEHLLTMATDIATPQDRAIQPEVAVVSNDDTRRTVRASTAVVQNESGKPVGMVSVLTDVAKHKELDHMEREFVAHVTHELRAPLSSIRASLEILAGSFAGKLAGDDEKIFNAALRNTDRLDDLIRNILDFSKLESGQMTVHPRASDPEKIARDGVDSMKPWCVKKGIDLMLDVEPGLPQVDSDSSRTVQVLVNLLSNAIKFTPAGGKIAVRVARGTGAQDRFVQYAVSDTGPGIDKKDHEKIFEKFVQIAAGEKHVGGTGLGLAIAKALIHLQKGQMWIDSVLGRGATFYFTLPVCVPKESAAVASPEPERPWWKRFFGG